MMMHTYSPQAAGTKRESLLQTVRYYLPLVVTAVLFIGCLAIELFGAEIEAETRDQFYGIFGSVMFYFSILLNAVYGKHYGLSWVKSLVFSYLSFRLLFSLTSVLWTDVDILVFGHGAVASFRSIMFLPVLCLILSRFCEADTLNLCDFLTPYFFFYHGIVTIACWIYGCCAGKPCGWGLQNPLSGMTVFPLQPGIILLSVAVAYWGLYYGKKYEYKANGMVFANSLCIYGVGRYLMELFSDDPRIVWVLSWLAVCSLAMIVQGFVFRYIAGKRSKTPY